MAANSVLSGVIVARILGAESLGILVVLNATVSIVIQFSYFGLPVANTYFTARDRENLAPAAMNGIVFAIVSGLVVGSIVWLFSPYFLPGVPTTLAAIGLLSVAFQLVTIILTNLFLAQNEVTKFNFLDLLNQSFVLINAILALLILGGGLSLLVSLNTAASGAMSILTAILLYRYISSQSSAGSWHFSYTLFRQMIGYAFKGHFLWVLTFLAYRVDLLIVNYFRGSVEASVYAVASQCTLFLLLLPNSVSHLLQTRVVSIQDTDGNFTCRVARHTSILLAAACIVSIPGALILPYIYGVAFSDLPIQLWILLPGVFFVGMQSVLTQYFIGTGLTWKLPACWVITVFINVGLDMLVVPAYGARSAAAVSTFCYVLIFTVVFALFRKSTGHGLTAVLIPNSGDLRNILQMLRSL